MSNNHTENKLEKKITETQTLTKHKQIFHDPSGNRWKLSLFLIFLFCILILTILIIGIPFSLNILSIQSKVNKNYTNQPLSKNLNLNKSFAILEGKDYKSTISLKENINKLDELILPFTKIIESENKIIINHDKGEIVDRINEIIEINNPNISKKLLISDLEYDIPIFQNRDINNKFIKLINNPEIQDGFIQSIIKTLVDKKYNGVVLELQDKTKLYNPILYEKFLEKFSKTLESFGFNLVSKVNIYSNAKSFDITKNNSSKLILENYQPDLYNKNPATAVDSGNIYSAQNILNLEANFQQLNRIITKYPDLNYSVVLPTQSIDWFVYQGEIGWQSQLKYSEIGDIITKFNPKIDFNPEQGFATTNYTDDKNQNHFIVINDATTIYNQIVKFENLKQKPISVGLEQLGIEEPRSLDIIISNDKKDQLNKLSNNFEFETEINIIGKGAINKLIKEAVFGQREVLVVNNQIVDSKITKLPTKAEVEKKGYTKGYIALTFDDGPNPKYTPQILDILKEYDVKATFFPIGSNVLDHPELTERIVKEGHQIGNHAYSHLRMRNMDKVNFINEINNTTNAIREVTGITPEYFRTPFNDFGEYETNSDLPPLKTLGELNLITAESDLDSLDYKFENDEQMFQHITKILDPENSSQILFHDSGGQSREPTIKALPKVIKYLKEKNYQIVTAEQLKNLNETSPQVQKDNKLESLLNTPKLIFFQILNKSDFIFRILLFIATSLGLIRLIVLLLGLIKHFKGNKYKDINIDHLDFPPAVSVLVPCYNEEKVICNTIHSVLKSKYHNFEVIIIDDCSTDNSLNLVKKEFSNNSKVKILTKPNGGKAEALNYGIKFANSEFIISMDADTMFLPNTINNLMNYFKDPKVGGVAGFVEIGNDYFYQKSKGQKSKFNWLTTCQRLEYIFGQNFDKQAYNGLGCVIVVPGAIGAWRKQVILDVGGYKTDTLAEDTDLTVRILRNGWNIEYCKDAFCITEAPETIKQFWKQRVRWQFGTLQVIVKNFSIIFNPKYKAVSMFAIPYLFFNFFSMLISPIANLPFFILIAKIFLGTKIAVLAFNQNDQDSLFWMFLFIAVYLVIELFSTIFAIWQYKGTGKWILLLFIPLQITVFRMLILIITIISIKKAFEGKPVGWGHLQRTGTVQSTNSI